jgi:hypothetical protein
VKVELHNIVAECPSCHGTDFEPHGVRRELIASQTPMACTRCGAHTSYRRPKANNRKAGVRPLLIWAAKRPPSRRASMFKSTGV